MTSTFGKYLNFAYWKSVFNNRSKTSRKKWKRKTDRVRKHAISPPPLYHMAKQILSENLLFKNYFKSHPLFNVASTRVGLVCWSARSSFSNPTFHIGNGSRPCKICQEESAAPFLQYQSLFDGWHGRLITGRVVDNIQKRRHSCDALFLYLAIWQCAN